MGRGSGGLGGRGDTLRLRAARRDCHNDSRVTRDREDRGDRAERSGRARRAVGIAVGMGLIGFDRGFVVGSIECDSAFNSSIEPRS